MPRRPSTSSSTSSTSSNDSLDLSQIEAERQDALEILLAFGPAFARSGKFWRSAFYSLLLGAITGAFALGFFNGFTLIFDWWSTDEYTEMLKSGDIPFGSGSWSWLYYTTSGGFLVGVLHNLPHFPSRVDGLFREVRDLHVDPRSAPSIFLASLLSFEMLGVDGVCSSSSTFFLISSLLRLGTGLNLFF